VSVCVLVGVVAGGRERGERGGRRGGREGKKGDYLKDEGCEGGFCETQG